MHVFTAPAVHLNETTTTGADKNSESLFTSCTCAVGDDGANCQLAWTPPLCCTPSPEPDPSLQHATVIGLGAEQVASNGAINIPTSAMREGAQCSAFGQHLHKMCPSPALPSRHFSAERTGRLGTIIYVPSPPSLLPAQPH